MIRAWILAAAVGALALAAGAAQAQSIVGVWRSQVQGTPSGMTGQVTSSDVQTLTLTADGRYQRQITVEGGNGVTGAAGNIIDAGAYRFTPPTTFEYQRSSWQICSALGCTPGQPDSPNQGSAPFVLNDATHATFIGLLWTRIQ